MISSEGDGWKCSQVRSKVQAGRRCGWGGVTSVRPRVGACRSRGVDAFPIQVQLQNISGTRSQLWLTLQHCWACGSVHNQPAGRYPHRGLGV
jgi:hypothetical protein